MAHLARVGTNVSRLCLEDGLVSAVFHPYLRCNISMTNILYVLWKMEANFSSGEEIVGIVLNRKNRKFGYVKKILVHFIKLAV